MKKLLAQFGLTIIGIALATTLNLAYAIDSPQGGVNNATQGDSISDATFDVGKTLTLDNNQQKQDYYKCQQSEDGTEICYPPLVAFVLQVLNYATAIIGSLAMILLIIGGFRFMVAGGVQQKIDEAKDMIKFVIIGLIFTFLSYTLTIFVQSVFIPEKLS